MATNRAQVFTTDRAARLWARKVGRTVTADHIGKLCRTGRLRARPVPVKRQTDGHPMLVWDIDRADLARVIAAARAREKRALARA